MSNGEKLEGWGLDEVKGQRMWEKTSKQAEMTGNCDQKLETLSLSFRGKDAESRGYAVQDVAVGDHRI